MHYSSVKVGGVSSDTIRTSLLSLLEELEKEVKGLRPPFSDGRGADHIRDMTIGQVLSLLTEKINKLKL